MRSLILLVPLLIALLAVLAQSPASPSPPTDSFTTARFTGATAGASDLLLTKQPQPVEQLARSDTLEVGGACVHLEAVSEWEIPPPHERTEKKLKLVFKNNSGIVMQLPHRGINDLRLSQAGSPVASPSSFETRRSGRGGTRSSTGSLELEPDESGIIVIRAVLYWHHGQLRLSFHDEMARMWSFKGIAAGAYEISVEYIAGQRSGKVGDWTGEVETTDLRIRIVAPKDTALEKLDF